MIIKVLFFGKLYDITKTDFLELKNISSIKQLKEYLHKQYPGFKNINYQISVNKLIEKEDRDLTDGDEIALLPPFAGG